MKNSVRILHPIIFLLLLSSIILAKSNQEYQLKAIFLIKFANFVTWEEEGNISDTTKPFVITVIGNTPIKYELERIISSGNIVKIKNKELKLRFITNISELGACNILFIAKTSEKELDEILQEVHHKAILTVSDTADYAERGVLINFYMNKEQNIRFEINYKKSLESRTSISSRLLKIAKIVE